LRTANIYRVAIGLISDNGKPTLRLAEGQTINDHQTIDSSLAGENGERSLLLEYPRAFVPVAFDLVEALLRLKTQSTDLPEIFDDHPSLCFWGESGPHDTLGKCIRAIHELATQEIEGDSQSFVGWLTAFFKGTPSLTLKSVHFDLVLKNLGKLGFEEELVGLLRDPRLYHYYQLFYWLEQSLRQLWPKLDIADRQIVLKNIHGVIDSPRLNGISARSQLLAVLPENDLTEAERIYSRERRSEFQFCSHPDERSHTPFPSELYGDHDNQGDQQTLNLPCEFPPDALKALSVAANVLSGNEVKIEVVESVLPGATKAAVELMPLLQAHLKELLSSEKVWVWDALKEILRKHHKPIRENRKNPPPALVEGCARISLSVLETQPSGLNTDPDAEMTGWGHTVWTAALDVAEVALSFPPADEDAQLQVRFENFLASVFAADQPLLQLVILCSIRNWHWFRNDTRRELHNRLIWQTPRRNKVLLFALDRSFGEPDDRRTEIYRLLLARNDTERSEAFARHFGEIVGIAAMAQYTGGTRSAVAGLLSEILQCPDKFKYIENNFNRRHFLRSVAFGLKNAVKDIAVLTEFAPDFGRWNLQIWRLLLPLRKKRQESEGVVLFALSPFERNENPIADLPKFRIWWSHLLPFCRAIVDEGGIPDCFNLFLDVKTGKFNHLVRIEELCDWVSALTDRLTNEYQRGLDLDKVDTAREEYSSWRNVLNYAAEALDSFRKDGSLKTELQRERVADVLGRLATSPYNVPEAMAALHQLRNEST
jgi:hypothetical protein